MNGSLKEKAFDNMQWTGVSSIYVAVVQLVNIFILAFFLSPDEIGTMTMLLLLVWLSQAFSDGGMSPAIIHHKIVAQPLLNTLFYLNIAFSVLLYGIVLLVQSPVSILFDVPELSDFIPVAGLVIIIAGIGTQFRVILCKELRFDLVARHEMGAITLNSIVAIAMAASGYGIWSMVIGYLAGTVLSTIILIYYGLRFWRPGFKLTSTGLGEFVRFGQYQVGERVMIFLNSRIDQLLIGALIGAQALGIYTIAHNFVVGPTIRVNQILSNVMFPVFSRIQDDLTALRNGYLKLLKIMMVINTPLLLGIAITAPVIVPLLFESQWHDSIYILQILSVYALIRSTGSPAGSLQLAKGRADLGFKWNFGLLFVSGPAIYAGSVLGGLPGIAYSQIALHTALIAPYWFLMIRPLIGPPGRDYFVSIMDAIVPGIFMGAGVWLMWIFTPGLPDIPRLILMILSGVLLFGIFLYKTEKNLFQEIYELVRNKYFPDHDTAN